MRTIARPTPPPQPDDLFEVPLALPDRLALAFAFLAGSYRDVRVLMRDGHVVGVRGPRWALEELKAKIERRARAEAAARGGAA